jgi:ATP-dependent DNA helicase RecG
VREEPGLDSPVSVVKGVGVARERALNSLGVRTLRDLMLHFPRKYEDRRRIRSFCELEEGKRALVVGLVGRVKSSEARRRVGGGRFSVFSAVLEQGNDRLTATWFNLPGLSAKVVPGTFLALFGKVEGNPQEWEMLNPAFEILAPGTFPATGILPVYPLAAGLSQVVLRKLVKQLLDCPQTRECLRETLSEALRKRCGLLGLAEAIEWLHFPPDERAWKAARKRIVFEEMFHFQVKLRKTRLGLSEGKRAPVIVPGERTKSFLEKVLPFKPSIGQVKALEEIWADLASPIPMRRLLHGEVGSGKTVVALGAAMAAIESGLKVAFMVPTEVLARQHYERAAPLLSSVGVDCALLAGREDSALRQRSLDSVKKEEPCLLFGTHALFQSGVSWRNLGLVIVDEQHRFGVSQKSALVDKGEAPHLLVMSATPIPRTVVLAEFGELDVSRLDETLPGRKPVETYRVGKGSQKGLLQRIKREVDSGGQVLWVCPLLGEKGSSHAASVKERLESIRLQLPGVPVGMLHGQMTSQEKNEALDRFEKRETGVLVATTVLEVGIDLPGATMIVVEDAERFGLSQLHQLRGRVGRGERGGICVLFSSPADEESAERLNVLLETTDGFALAEEDLRLRGPGALSGLRQHGATEFRIADLARDTALFVLARAEAQTLCNHDALLNFSSWVCKGSEEKGEGSPLLG